MLRITGLTKTYKTGDKALNGINLQIPAGQVVGLIGPSGAGKSSLIRCVNRLIEPTAGKIFLGERDVTALSRSDLRVARRRIGMIFQEYALVERLTVMENVLSGRLGYVPFWRSFYVATRRLRTERICASGSRWFDGSRRQARRCSFRRSASARRDCTSVGARPRAASCR